MASPSLSRAAAQSAQRVAGGVVGPRRVEAILALRRIRMTGPEIAELLEMPPATVSAVLLREGLGKLSCLELPEPPNRYERACPGELIHVDVKKLARIAVGFLRRAVAFFASHGAAVERVMTDNGSPYISAVHAAAALGAVSLLPAPLAARQPGRSLRSRG